ncbi:MAG: DUF4386 domain-containing protein [Pseudomonadota bacterium]
MRARIHLHAVSCPSPGWAAITGLAILAMAILGGFAFASVHSTLHVAGDPLATESALRANLTLFHATVWAWVIVALLDLLVALGVYRLFRALAPQQTLIAAVLRGGYALVLIVATSRLAKLWIDDGYAAGALGFSQFEQIWSAGLVLFGAHLLALARLGWKVAWVARPVAILLGLGGLGYLVIEGGQSLLGSALTWPQWVSVGFGIPMVLGELSFALQLLISAIGGRPCVRAACGPLA